MPGNYTLWAVQYGRFLPCNAMLSTVYVCLSVCLSVSLSLCVCVSVTLRYCIKTAKRRITQIMPHDRPGTLVFKWMFCSCRISTDNRIAQSLCNSRASCQTIRYFCNNTIKCIYYGYLVYDIY